MPLDSPHLHAVKAAAKSTQTQTKHKRKHKPTLHTDLPLFRNFIQKWKQGTIASEKQKRNPSVLL